MSQRGNVPISPIEHPALRGGLITYIGNKRGLIPFINDAIDRIENRAGPLRSMADPFAGSGVVGRLGRIRGMEVLSGDVEEYTRPLGRAFLETDPSTVDSLFPDTGGYKATLALLNALSGPGRSEDRLFSRHYAPVSTGDADPTRERLFYTQENASRIDAMLAAIHRDLPLTGLGRDILLAGLLVEMSIHNNTSGVMKGFHHGWGGRGGDALSRIMAPIMLEALPFIRGPRGRVAVGPAADVLAEAAADRAGTGRGHAAFDLVYADPPYNIHQYGANYHLLTTAVLWDFYDPGPVEQGSRAGIRTDHYRSDFCRRATGRAAGAFQSFLDATDTRTLLVSYNNDGILSPQEIVEMLSEDGINTVTVLSTEYAKFRGGKATQSAIRTDEYLFCVYRGVRQSQTERDTLRAQVDELTLRREMADRFLLPSRWVSSGGTVVPPVEPRRGTVSVRTLSTPSGSRITLTRELRVQDIWVATGVPEEGGRLAGLATDGSGTILEAIEELVDLEEYRSAITLLQRLKIKKYRKEFLRYADRLASAPLSPTERTRLRALVIRVTAEKPPADRHR